jgi:hypothetical protein
MYRHVSCFLSIHQFIHFFFLLRPFCAVISISSKEWPNPVSKNCYGETAPVTGLNSTGQASGQEQVIQAVLRGMKSPVRLLDITALSAMRKDAHPSVYSGDFSPAQRANRGAGGSVDCSHWCLPGLPDTWNQLFYTLLFYK